MIEVARRIILMLACACALVVVACKSNSISSGTTTGSNVIGPNGGVVSLADGAEVRIPAGALTKDTTITVAVAGPSEYPSAGLYTFASKVYSFTPHGLKFNTAVVIDIPFTPTTDLVALHADPGGQWNVVTAMIGTAAAEISATSFSFYAVASTTTAGDVGPSCSGRGPDNSALTAKTASGFTGMIAATGQSPAADLTTMVDGYAVQHSPTYVELVLTPYQKGCGHYANGANKIGAVIVHISIVPMVPVGAMTYTGMEIGASSGGAKQVASGCQVDGTGFGGTSTGAGVTVTAIDSVHLAGSFDFTPQGGTPLTGTFDVPFCKEHAGLNPPYCCIP